MEIVLENTFAQEVLSGLTRNNKTLPSKYFYDEIGDHLFQKIMALPEYYLTRTELQILQENKSAILEDFNPNKRGFDLLELGAGDGLKTKILLKELLSKNINFTYRPLDISINALTSLQRDLQQEMPNLDVDSIHGDYFDSLKRLKENHTRQKLVMFLGSNIGNLTLPESQGFLQQLKENLNPNDGLLIGFDLKKDPAIILPAYNDKDGVTAAFNLNLLSRINKELDANFNLDNFKHCPCYDPETGLAKSYLVSTCKQSVYLKQLDQHIHFFAWESIHTEISLKYDHNTIIKLAHNAGLQLKEVYTDPKKYYANYLFTV